MCKEFIHAKSDDGNMSLGYQIGDPYFRYRKIPRAKIVGYVCQERFRSRSIKFRQELQ